VDWLIWMAGWSSADELRLQYAGPAVPDSTKEKIGSNAQGGEKPIVKRRTHNV